MLTTGALENDIQYNALRDLVSYCRKPAWCPYSLRDNHLFFSMFSPVKLAVLIINLFIHLLIFHFDHWIQYIITLQCGGVFGTDQV